MIDATKTLILEMVPANDSAMLIHTLHSAIQGQAAEIADTGCNATRGTPLKGQCIFTGTIGDVSEWGWHMVSRQAQVHNVPAMRLSAESDGSTLADSSA